MSQQDPTLTINSSTRGRGRIMLGHGVSSTCEHLLNHPETVLASQLLKSLQIKIGTANKIAWKPPTNGAAGISSTVWVGDLLAEIDDGVFAAIEKCVQLLTQCQIATLQVGSHPADVLARAILEKHQTVFAGWTLMRSVPMLEDDYLHWRSYVSCAVELQNQTAELTRKAQLSNTQSSQSPGIAQIAMTALSSLLLQGQVSKDQAVHVVSRVAEFVSLCNSLDASTPARQAWDKVNDSLAVLQPGMPTWKVTLLFPRRFLLQTSSPGTSPSLMRLKALDETSAMRIVDDYQRLSESLRFTPVLLERVNNDDTQLADTLSIAFRTARASLLAAASMLRALYRRQMIRISENEDDDETALNELDRNEMQFDDDDDDVESSSTFDWSAVKNRPAPTESSNHNLLTLNNPKFCEVCFRSVVSRKFCSLHVNTGGKSRQEIRAAQQFLPQYQKFLLVLPRTLDDSNRADSRDARLDSCTYPRTLERLQEQTITLLAKLVAQALSGVPADKFPEAQSQMDNVARVIESKIQNVSVTPPGVWIACANAVADLKALSQEIEIILSQVDLLADPLHDDHQEGALLGDELRLFLSAYIADILLRITDLCINAQAIPLLPEDIRRDFYTSWFNGYKPLHSAGHQPNTEARDPDFIVSRYDASAFNADVLWEHFSRLAAWRKSKQVPPARKPRRRLNRESVMSLVTQGMSIEQMSKHLAFTPEAIQAALARWNVTKPVA